MRYLSFILLLVCVEAISLSAKPKKHEVAATDPTDATSSDPAYADPDADNLNRAYANLRDRQAVAATQPQTPEQKIIELNDVIDFLKEQVSDLKQQNDQLRSALANPPGGAKAVNPPAPQQQIIKEGDLAIGMTLDDAEKSTHAQEPQLISEDADGTKIYRWRKWGPKVTDCGMVDAIFRDGQLVSYQNDPQQ